MFATLTRPESYVRIAILPFFTVTIASAAYAYSGQELAKDARIDLSKARAIAQNTRPGKITKEELEREPGGSGLRYSFVIKSGVKLYEVGIDARTGAVLENIVEGPNPD
jgi:uncharacterized membrane protein YkoI